MVVVARDGIEPPPPALSALAICDQSSAGRAGNGTDADSRKQTLGCKKPLTGSIALAFLCSSAQIEGYETFT
jgi:hypothetical protein